MVILLRNVNLNIYFNILLEIFCRSKWNNIRTGFTRSLKAKGPGLSGIIGMKRKYYLHNSLEFLLPHVKHRQSKTMQLLQPPGTDTILDNISNDNEEFSCFDAFSDVSEEEMAPSSVIKIEKHTTNGIDTVSCESPGTASEPVQSSSLSTKPADALTQFLNGIMPDIQALSAKSQRKFKFKLVNILEELYDEEEIENIGKDDF